MYCLFFRYQCPDQCESASPPPQNNDEYGVPAAPPVQDTYGSPQSAPQSYGGPVASSRRRREAGEEVEIGKSMSAYKNQKPNGLSLMITNTIFFPPSISDLEDVGVEKVIQVVSSGDLTFAIKEGEEEEVEYPTAVRQTLTDDGYICMSTPAFAATLVILLAILVISCLLSAFLCLRHRSFYGESSLIAAFANPVFAHKKGHF